MKRAFTLVELLVVISILSMLASIIMVRISLAQATGRDSVRTQQIRQIDLATKLYVDTYKKAPLVVSKGCAVQTLTPPTDDSDVSGCFAVSSNGTAIQRQNWETLKEELREFIDLPEDPCGTCTSGSENFSIGYTYVAPYAMQYFCSINDTCVATDDSYQLYAPLERQSVPTGNDGLTDNYAQNPDGSSGGGATLPSAPTDFAVTLAPQWVNGSLVQNFNWTASTDDVGVVEYRVYSTSDSSNPIATSPSTSAEAIVRASLQGQNGLCYLVRAYDASDNPSEFSNQDCIDVPYAITTPQITEVVYVAAQNSSSQQAAVGLAAIGPMNTSITWTVPTNNSDGTNLHYKLRRLGVPSYVSPDLTENSITIPGTTAGCWQVQAFAGFPEYEEPKVYISSLSPQFCN